MTKPSSTLPLPHNLEAEASVLGSLLLDNRVYADLQDLLVPESFYKEAHRQIYRAAVDLLSAGRPADLVTVADRLRASGELERVGGPAYLAQLSTETTTSLTAKFH